MTWLNLAVLAAILGTVVEPVRFDRCLQSRRVKARWELPANFREVSGLALSADGRLFLHGDETGRIGVMEAETGKWLGSFELGSTSPRDDFEDIAIAGDYLYLITHAGKLYQVAIPPKDRTTGTLPYTVFETKAGRICEIEGLAFDPTDQVLLLGCKTMKSESGGPAVLRWSLAEQRLAKPEAVVLKASSPFSVNQGKRLRPSALALDPTSDRWIVISSADSRLVVADRQGAILTTAPIPKRHQQPEGLALSESGLMYLSDEGGKGPGSVTAYDCR